MTKEIHGYWVGTIGVIALGQRGGWLGGWRRRGVLSTGGTGSLRLRVQKPTHPLPNTTGDNSPYTFLSMNVKTKLWLFEIFILIVWRLFPKPVVAWSVSDLWLGWVAGRPGKTHRHGCTAKARLTSTALSRIQVQLARPTWLPTYPTRIQSKYSLESNRPVQNIWIVLLYMITIPNKPDWTIKQNLHFISHQFPIKNYESHNPHFDTAATLRLKPDASSLLISALGFGAIYS